MRREEVAQVAGRGDFELGLPRQAAGALADDERHGRRERNDQQGYHQKA